MNRRQVVKMALDHAAPPYVPWSFRFTQEPWKILVDHFGGVNPEELLGNHILAGQLHRIL